MKKVLLVIIMAMALAFSLIASAAEPVALAGPGKKPGLAAPPAPPPGEGAKKPPAPPPGDPAGKGADPKEQASAQTNAQPTISAEDAQNAALNAIGGGIVARTELKYPKHGVEYKVIIVDGDYRYDVHVNGTSGAVRDYKSHQITKTGASASRSGAVAAIDAQSAKDIAIANADDGIVTECKLDYKPHLGTLAYHIHVANGQYEICVEINASSGDVFKVEHRYKP